MDLEEKVEELSERLEKVEKENNELKKRNRKLESAFETITSRSENLEQNSGNEISRRGFLRKLGAGAAGLGALGISSASGLKLTKNSISNNSGFDFLDSGSQYFKINDGGPVEINNTNLRVATGQAIEDGSGVKRFSIVNSDQTRLLDGEGFETFTARGSGAANPGGLIRTDNGKPLKLFDVQGAFTALQYNSSSSAPGTLELTNAGLDLYGHVTLFGNTSDRSKTIYFSTTQGESCRLRGYNGELEGRDSAGNATILT